MTIPENHIAIPYGAPFIAKKRGRNYSVDIDLTKLHIQVELQETVEDLPRYRVQASLRLSAKSTGESFGTWSSSYIPKDEAEKLYNKLKNEGVSVKIGKGEIKIDLSD